MMVLATAPFHVAQAARPLVTDDADVLDTKACEWESFGARLRNGLEEHFSAWQSGVTCGMPAMTQVFLGYGRSSSNTERSDAIAVGGKLQLMQGDDTSPRLAVSANLDELRFANDAFQLRDQALNLIVSQTFSNVWTCHANLGWIYSRPSRHSSTTWGLALERSIDETIDLVGELYGDDRTQPWGSAGLRWAPTLAFSLNASFGLQVRGHASNVAGVGLKLSF